MLFECNVLHQLFLKYQVSAVFKMLNVFNNILMYVSYCCCAYCLYAVHIAYLQCMYVYKQHLL